jgi:hypothetical protein
VLATSRRKWRWWRCNSTQSLTSITMTVENLTHYFKQTPIFIKCWFCCHGSFREHNHQVREGKIKVKQSRNRPGLVQRVPGGLGSQISMTFSTWRWWGHQPHALSTFTSRKCSRYTFSLGAESNPGPWYGRKEYVTEKYSDTTSNQSRDRPTSSAAPWPLRHPRPQVREGVMCK